jgi:hypothetical protein
VRHENPIFELLHEQLDEGETDRLSELMASLGTVLPMLDELSTESMLACTAADWMAELDRLVQLRLRITIDQLLHLYALAADEQFSGREAITSLATDFNQEGNQ